MALQDDLHTSNTQVSRLTTQVSRLTQVTMSNEHPLSFTDLAPIQRQRAASQFLAPIQRQRAASQFRKTSFSIFAKLRRDGFVVLDVPTGDKHSLCYSHQSLMGCRCKTDFSGAFLSARHLGRRHVLEFNAGSSAVLVAQELPLAEDDWTQTCQTEAYEAMHTLKTVSTCVLDAISFSMGLEINNMRNQLLEDDVPRTDATVSSSALQVASYAAAATSGETMELASQERERERERENYIDASHLGLMRCSNCRLQNV